MKAEKFNQPLLNMMNSPSSAADVWTRRQPETDTENQKAVDDMNTPPVHTYDELKKIRRDAYIKMAVIVVIIVTALVFGSVAWFTQSREVEGSAVRMTASDLSFEIRVAENSDASYWSAYKGLINLADSNYKDGYKQTVGEDEEAVDYYMTNGNNDSIVWRLDSDDLTENDSIIIDGLKPNSCGTLSFDIIPKINGDLAVDIKLNIRGFTAVYPTQEEIEDEDDPQDPDTIKALNEVSNSSSTDEKNAVKYINGHILYFTDKTSVNDKNIYSGYIENNIYHWQKSDVIEGRAEPVKIHWIWVNTVDQIILKSTDAKSNPIIGDSETENDQADKDRKALLSYIKRQNTSIFDSIDLYDEYNDSNALTYDFSAKLDDFSYDNYKKDEKLRNKMTDSYNAADQIIGTNLNYVLIDMKVIESQMKNN